MNDPSAFNIGLNTSMKSVLDDCLQNCSISRLVSFTVGRKEARTGLGFNETKEMRTLG